MQEYGGKKLNVYHYQLSQANLRGYVFLPVLVAEFKLIFQVINTIFFLEESY